MASCESFTDRDDEQTGLVDATLYRAACDGDDAATDHIVRRYHSVLLAQARGRTANADHAEDAVQFAWMQLLSHIRRVREEGVERLRKPTSLRYWLMKTARRAVTDVYRDSRRTSSLTDRYGREQSALGRLTVEVDVEEEREVLARWAQINDALDTLTDKQRNLLGLLLVDPPLSYDEIARRAGIPVGSIGPTRQRCVSRLRREIARNN